jgi:hypothetical protein
MDRTCRSVAHFVRTEFCMPRLYDSAAERTWVELPSHCVPQPVDLVHLVLCPLHLPAATLLWVEDKVHEPA